LPSSGIWAVVTDAPCLISICGSAVLQLAPVNEATMTIVSNAAFLIDVFIERSFPG
jgi:hypothetical protein